MLTVGGKALRVESIPHEYFYSLVLRADLFMLSYMDQQEVQVEEIQGLYGPFSVSERLIQKIWLRQDFVDTAMQTVSGKSLVVKDPGRWNFQEGPDFLESQLLIDGQDCVGDVEVHFDVRDWWSHAHGKNPNFNRVRLHVVLYPPDPTAPVVRTGKGFEPETFVLMTYLDRDLESHAMDAALLELESQDELEWVAQFLQNPLAEREAILHQQMATRWTQKLHYAQIRLHKTVWAQACHQCVLEVLGYARNRAPMTRIADRYPFEVLQSSVHTAETLYVSEVNTWKLNSLRPANHPKRRLAQYLQLMEQRPDWPERLLQWGPQLPQGLEVELSRKQFRRQVQMSALVQDLGESVFAGIFSSSRLHTLCCDALFPLLTAYGLPNLQMYWMHWYPGDMPVALRRFLKRADLVSPAEPFSHGALQAALALSLSRAGAS